MDSLGGVADNRPLHIYVYERNGFGENFPPKWKISQIKIASSHKPIPRNNLAKFTNYPMDSLGGVADKGPLYISTSKKWFGEISPKIPPNWNKIPKLK